MTKRCRHFFSLILFIYNYEGLTPPSLLSVALGALGNGENEKNTRGLLFPRGLRHHRYFGVALRGFFIRKNDVLVVQAQEGVDEEVNHPMLPLGALRYLIPLNLLNLLNLIS